MASGKVVVDDDFVATSRQQSRNVTAYLTRTTNHQYSQKLLLALTTEMPARSSLGDQYLRLPHGSFPLQFEPGMTSQDVVHHHSLLLVDIRGSLEHRRLMDSIKSSDPRQANAIESKLGQLAPELVVFPTRRIHGTVPTYGDPARSTN